MKVLSVFLTCIIIVVGSSLFRLKYQVLTLEQTYQHLKKTHEDTKETITVLRAEWAHLNDPQRLQLLAEKYLDLEPVAFKQIVGLRDITSGDIGYDVNALDKLIQEIDRDTKQREEG